ncbi:MAG: 23S rRNA (uracil-5-)-methyltransferase RumA [Candidatus Margulisbacteria bacterium GWF2_35_9]|nr:MAG: 23S rRNA (uracil-5-)-methyltransferase RumA [Candidatus Margulisbacteria bacterium GWF2_35_9]
MEISKTCPIFGVCGGCKLYNLTYDDQLKFKEDFVQNKLKRYDLPILPIIPSPIVYHYRNKIELTFFNTEDKKIGLGFHQKGEFNKLVNVSACLHSPESNADIIEFIRQWANKHSFSAYHKITKQGLLRYLLIRDSFKNQSKLITFITNGGSSETLKELALALYNNFKIDGVLWSNQPEIADAVLLTHCEILCGKDYLIDTIGDYTFKIPVNSFFQGNTAAATLLYDYIKQLVQSGDEVLDLFCGAGTISTYIADKAKSVLGIEVVDSAVDIAQENSKLNHVQNTSFEAGRVRERLANMKFDTHFDTVILDPPRAGTDKKTMRRIGELNPKQVIYVACGYENLVYNLNVLMEGPYRIESIQPIDLFPNTPHVETVINLLKK